MENVNGHANEAQGTLNFLMEKHLTSQDDELLHAIADYQAHNGEGLSPGEKADAVTAEIKHRDREATLKLISATIIRAEMAQKFRSSFVPGDERFDGHGGDGQKLRRIKSQMSKIREAEKKIQEQCEHSKELVQERAQLEEEQNQADAGESQQLTVDIEQKQYILNCTDTMLRAGDFSPEMFDQGRKK